MIGIKSDKIITKNGIFNGYIYFDKNKIVDITTEPIYGVEIIDRKGLYVSPGFIDMHTHGGNNHPFINCTNEDVALACDFHLLNGTTSILPTVTAGPFNIMKDAVEKIAYVKEHNLTKANIIGAHLEGPYLSKEQCGAQCPTFITPPIKEDYAPFVSQMSKYISRWTYAPENDNDGEFAQYLYENNIIPSIGHSNAKEEDVICAMKHHANIITHLYSCTSTITRDNGFRHLGIIECAYLYDDLYVEIIADGRHLPINLIKLILKCKGYDKVALVTDSLSIAGTDIVSGEMSGTKFIVEDGVCKLADRSAFAGSIATANRLVKTIYKDVGVDIVNAVKMITQVPAKILKLDSKGILSKNYDADIVVFDENINITDVFVSGNKVK